MNRLTVKSYPDTTKVKYIYDPVGNRLSNVSGSGWSNNTSNELTSRPGVTYTYDNNGNTLTKADSTGTTNYTWDFENRLASVTLPGSGGSVSFKYDPFGRRIYKSSSTGTSVFAYDGDNLVEETNAAGGVVARYSQGLNIDEPLAMLRSSTTSYYQADGLGSVTSLTNAAGTAAQNYTYDSFGNIVATTGSLVNSFRYTGREWDAETSLYYYRARYYDPMTGRFISQDPLGFGGGDANLYSYVWNSPPNFFDPVGQFGWPVHVRITNDALRDAGLSPDPAMAQQVAAVDLRPGSQGTDAAATNTHSMAGKKDNGNTQSCSEAYKGTVDEISQDVSAGDFTKALHTIQDAYSPSHYPFQPWSGGSTPLHIPSPAHIYGDLFPPQSAIDAATKASAQFLRDITHNPAGPFGPIDPKRYLPANPCSCGQ